MLVEISEDPRRSQKILDSDNLEATMRKRQRGSDNM